MNTINAIAAEAANTALETATRHIALFESGSAMPGLFKSRYMNRISDNVYAVDITNRGLAKAIVANIKEQKIYASAWNTEELKGNYKFLEGKLNFVGDVDAEKHAALDIRDMVKSKASLLTGAAYELEYAARDLPTLEYTPEWANNTGYMDGAVNADVEQTCKFVDDKNRHGVIVKCDEGNIVIFERYSNGADGVVVYNCHKHYQAIMAVIAGSSNLQSDVVARLLAYVDNDSMGLPAVLRNL